MFVKWVCNWMIGLPMKNAVAVNVWVCESVIICVLRMCFCV